MTLGELHPSCPPGELLGSDAAAPVAVAVVTRPVRHPTTDAAAERRARLRAIVDRHYDFVWRAVRSFGVPDAIAEDAAQQVLCVLARRLDQIAPGAEMSFLFSTARRVASEVRRSARRRPAAVEREVDALATSSPNPEELVDERQAQAILRDVLDAMPVDLRVVFVLFELEELTLAQVAEMVGIPAGTAASRLRRARETFRGIVRRMQAAQGDALGGGGS